jgi:hypothetical protein
MPLVLAAFRLCRRLLSANDSCLDRVCFSCRRIFRDWCCGSPWAWLVQHLERNLLPVLHHGIVTTDLRPPHAEDQLQQARGREIQWTWLDQPTWVP